MSDRTSTRPEPRPALEPTLPEAVRVRRRGLRPSVEGLEGRTLLSYGGAADLSFGTGGFQAIKTGNGVASALQADAKLVVTGTSFDATNVSRNFIVSRFNTDGTLDPSFGSAGSFTNPALSFVLANLGDSRVASGEAIAIQPDGKIVVVGEVGSTAKVVRLNTDGTLDTGFGTGGIVTLGTRGGGQGAVAFAQAVALLPGGKIAVGGAFEATINIDAPAVQRLNADGSVDTTFNHGGLALAPLPSDATTYPFLRPLDGNLGFGADVTPVNLVAQPNGSIILGASAVTTGPTIRPVLGEIVLTRFTTAGTLDPTYGTAGQVVVTPRSILPAGTSANSSALALQTDGKLIVGGAITIDTPGNNGTGPAPQILAMRLDANGKLDPGFGVGGAFILTGVGSSNSVVGAIALQPDGKVVLADAVSSDYIRLTAMGLPDAEFGVAGKSFPITPFGTGQDGATSLSVLPDGKLIATLAFNAGEIVRLLGEGAVNDYDNDGQSDPAVYDTTTGRLTYFSTLKQTTVTIPFGAAGAGQTLPAPGAYDGGGLSEVAVYLPTQGAFANLTPTFGYGSTVPFGTPGVGQSLPALGDYDLSGKTEYAVYLPAIGAFAYRPGAGGKDVIVGFGTPGAGQSIPAPADYFGTGQTDLAVYLPDQGAFAIRNPVTNQDAIIPFGTPGAGQVIPVPGDYDGSGHAELAVYLPQYAELIYRSALEGRDVVESFGIAGAGLTLPAPGDYDGSGQTEVAAYYPTLGLFDFRPANGGPDVIFKLGTANPSIPFVMVSATDGAAGGSGGGNGFNRHAASLEVPLTSDILDSIAGLHVRKKPGSA